MTYFPTIFINSNSVVNPFLNIPVYPLMFINNIWNVCFTHFANKNGKSCYYIVCTIVFITLLFLRFFFFFFFSLSLHYIIYLSHTFIYFFFMYFFFMAVNKYILHKHNFSKIILNITNTFYCHFFNNILFINFLTSAIEILLI